MSISPQSLARTRDKRSLRIPARFDDFSEIPRDNIIKKSPFHPSISMSNGAKSSLKQSAERSSSSKRRPTSSMFRLGPESQGKNSNRSTPESAKTPSQLGPETSSKSPSPSASASLSPQLPRSPSTFATAIDEPESPTINQNPPSPDPIAELTRPVLETATDQNRPVLEAALVDQNRSITEPPAKVIRLLESPSKSKQVSKKKSKGSSLIKPNNGTFQTLTNINRVNNNANNNNLQQARYFNTQNVQYGPRYLYNEPLLLPQSVGSIQPITATIQAIANQARRPPFVSKRAAAFISYQDERKMDLLLSNFKALIRVASHLEVKDLLNLRLVNKTWRSVVDSREIWRNVTLNSPDNIVWDSFMTNVLMRFKTNELKLNGLSFVNAVHPASLADKIASSHVERLRVRTTNAQDNLRAIQLISELVSIEGRQRRLRIYWEVGVVIHDCGLATVDFDKDHVKLLKGYEWMRHREKPNLDLKVENYSDNEISLDLSDLEALIFRCDEEDRVSKPSNRPELIIKPI